ncbi:MAG TPA: DNA repair protein RadA [Alphaproteobacteria bacterium]|nr:DNA repair protein RadA [Alphaproteobacteria bacterium]
MARTPQHFVCQSCGAVSAKWAGRCEACNAWNSISEEAAEGLSPGQEIRRGRRIKLLSLSGSEAEAPRLCSGIAEFDRVCGGGLMPGSALLVGGDPGIGKSTLLLQAAAALAQRGIRALYISGEESVAQIRLRAKRMEVQETDVELGVETRLGNILATIETQAQSNPSVIIIDSIQTMMSDVIEAAAGTVTQLRASAQELVRVAKRTGAVVIMVGHVTKEGQIAGPRVIEHMVDTVLYFEGDRGHQFRILRAVKNRFGPTDEIGVFEMTGTGLRQVENPSALFLAGRQQDVTGSVVFAGVEGTRPLLVEIQALTAPSSLGTPRRTVVGWDSGRLSMVIAVLEARCGLRLGANDVYLNVAGGLRISEPAADLAVAAALTSSHTGVALPQNTVVFGEISLSGEIRPVAQTDARLKEAAKLGFTHAITPAGNASGQTVIKLDEIPLLAQLVEDFQARSDSLDP